MTALPLLPGHHWGVAYAINNFGEAVGHSESRAVRWVAGVAIALDAADATQSEARGINDRGDIVGSAQRAATGPYPQAVIWEGGVMRNLPAPMRPGCAGDGCTLGLASTASAINEHGTIVGVAADFDEVVQAVRWAGGAGAALPFVPEGGSSEAAGINDAGDIAGYTSVVRGDLGFTVATLWSGEDAWELPVFDPALPYGLALAIGNGGHVAGSLRGNASATHAVLWIIRPDDGDGTPPVVSVRTDSGTIWPPNGRLVPVTFTGTATDEGSGVGFVSFRIEDEYGRVEPAGPVTLSDGRFSIIVHLEASRRGDDRDGRRYVMHVTATDLAGNGASATAALVVRHDRR